MDSPGCHERENAGAGADVEHLDALRAQSPLDLNGAANCRLVRGVPAAVRGSMVSVPSMVLSRGFTNLLVIKLWANQIPPRHFDATH